jgi:hypothetical protein
MMPADAFRAMKKGLKLPGIFTPVPVPSPEMTLTC